MKSLIVRYNLFILITLQFTSVAYPQAIENRIFNNSTLRISEINTNSIHSDFGSSVVQDSLYFTAFNDKFFEKRGNKLKKKAYYDLYKAAIDRQGNVISNRDPIERFITRYNDGPVSWCLKTGELFVTQNYADQSAKLKPFQKEINRLRIMIEKQVNGKWEQAVGFSFNNPEYSVGHPAISESGDTLVFSSDKPGGYGETDLYYSVRKNGEWEFPVNLGPQVNTSGKDEFPFITGSSYPERFLIFASTGHNSKGGFDLFFRKLNDPKGEVYQFNEPINSANDDFAMNLPENVEFGFMTSNRPGTGSDDIYKLTFEKYFSYLQELFVIEAKTLKPIPQAHVDICKKYSGETGEDGKISYYFEQNSVCNVTASALGYKDNSKTIQIGRHKQGTVLRDTIFMEMIVNEKIVLKNIYYDFDKWNILPESSQELDRLVSLMNENPEMKVELSAHTDQRGTKKYNLKLSQLRGQAAVDYIISRGINKLRVAGKGYGETQLINKCHEQCTPAQHRENRRTEIYIPGFLKGEPVNQKAGDYSNGEPDHVRSFDPLKTHVSLVQNNVNVSNLKGGAVRFYLILGSFKEKINATKLIQQLKADGDYEATILGGFEPFKVGIGYKNLSMAENALDVLKNKYKGAWISGNN